MRSNSVRHGICAIAMDWFSDCHNGVDAGRRWDGRSATGLNRLRFQGCKYFKLILELLERLHGQATERDRAGNREFYCNQNVRRAGWAPPGNRLWTEPTLG